MSDTPTDPEKGNGKMHGFVNINGHDGKAETAEQFEDSRWAHLTRLPGWAALVERPRWVVWRAERKNPKARWKKVPYSPHTGRKTDTTKPSNGGTLAQAVARMHAMGINPLMAGTGGIGFILGDAGDGWHYTGIDLDTCIDPDSGRTRAWAKRTKRDFPTYAELSPSMTGYKVFMRVRSAAMPGLLEAIGKDPQTGKQLYKKKWPRGAGKHPPATELHLGAGYFTVTGDSEPDHYHDLCEVQPERLHALIESENAHRRSGPGDSTKSAQGEGEKTDGGPRDNSDSGKAWHLVEEVWNDGEGTLDDYIQALNEAGLGEWAEDERQVERTWERRATQLEARAASREAAADGLGVEPGTARGKRPSNLLNALKLLRSDPALGGMLAFDQMQSRVVLRHPVPAFGKPAGSGDWTLRPIEDNDVTAVQEYMQAAGLASLSWEVLNRGMHRRAAENAFHPVREYLDDLFWDGVPRLDSWLSVYLGAEDKPYTRAMGRMFLIQMVARVFRPGCKADYMLVLEGPQGVEKSKVCSILGGQWYGDHMPPLHGDDVRVSQYLRGKWVIEMAELHALSRTRDEHLKAWLSRQTEDYIPKYGRNNGVEPRQFVPIGTTNPEGGNTPLKDSTGARRLWPVAVGSIDLEGLERDRDQLFAEAVRDFATGEQWWPDPDFEREHFAPEQEARTEVSPWLEKIDDYLKRETAGLPVRLLEVAREVMNIPSDRLATAVTPKLKAEIGVCLRQLGWVCKRSKKNNQWEPGPDWRAG